MKNMENQSINRRNFIKFTGLGSAAFVLGISSINGKNTVENLNGIEEIGAEISPYIIIEKSGKITLINNKPEMGQGTAQSITALIAEELEVRPDQYEVKAANGQAQYGRMQFSGGSFSVRMSYTEMRNIGASAKEMLMTAAANQWGVGVEECYAENATIIHKPTGKKLTYGELAEAASKLTAPKTPKLKDPKDFKIIGKDTKRPDIPLKVRGKAGFGIDAEIEGMVYASIERSNVFGSKIVSIDTKETMKQAGVLEVINVERDQGAYKFTGVAVIATNYWAALKGRKALKIKWDHQGNDAFNTSSYYKKLREMSKNEGAVQHSQGNFDEAFKNAGEPVEAFYETCFVTHSPMEPMNCTAYWKEDGKLEIWAPTQVPGSVINDFPKKYGIAKEDIELHVTYLGGGFGRRLSTDFIIEAVNISKAIKKPVKLVWTREDDTLQGPFRPPTFSAMKGSLKNGKLDSWQHKVISPTLDPMKDETVADRTMTEAISEQKYLVPNMKNTFVYAPINIPLGAWRSVTSSTLAFAHECFMDEMAVKAGQDPMEFRLNNMEEGSDAQILMKKLKEVSGWDKPLPKGKGRGVAQYEFFAGLAGEVVEVSQVGNAIKIDKVYAVIDLGTVVNPDTVRAQMEGAVSMGITAAIKNGISFEKGAAQQTNFHDNPVIRMNEMPEVEVHILTGGKRMKGVGEPGLPPVAPALANAIFAATGKRLRKLPLEIDFV
ncbi:MAG: hypothetical protein RIR51_1558 [Bacteroidota bacterium]|jgi:isoquinoline 1-oxidoreductase beta subunit